MSEEIFLEQEEYSAIVDLLVEESRRDFPTFLHTLWPQVEGQSYIISKFHSYLAELVQGVDVGTRNPHQSVSVPPQHGKSRLLSVRAVAWILGKHSNVHVAMTGFSFSLLSDFLREVKEIMSSPMYMKIFPNVEPVEGYNRAGAVVFTNGSSVQVTSSMSKLTGRRVDWLIVDDPHAGRFEAESLTARRKIEQWFYGDCITRLSPDAKVFLISTRWHVEDLHGIVTSEEKVTELVEAGYEEELFEVTNLKAVADADDPLGREIGEALFPEQRDTRFLGSLKIKMPSYEWDSQYMGDPRMSMGEVVDIKKIKKIDLLDVPNDIEWYRGWDPAITESTAADYTCGALCALRRNENGEVSEFYIIDIIRLQAAWAKMRFTMIETSRNDMMRDAPIARTGIEGVSGFVAVMEDVKRELMGVMAVEPRNFRGGKLLRAQPWLNLVEAGRVYMVTDRWNKEFTLELEKFPLGSHDDQVDAISIAFEGLMDVPMLLLA